MGDLIKTLPVSKSRIGESDPNSWINYWKVRLAAWVESGIGRIHESRGPKALCSV